MAEIVPTEILDQEGKLNLTPCLIVFAGLPATGKSTLASRIAARTNAQLLDIDKVRSELLPQTKSHIIDLEGERLQMFAAYQSMYKLALDNLKKGTPIILSATFSSTKSHEEAEKIASEAAVPFKVFSLNAPTGVLEGRLLTRKGHADNYSNVTTPAHLKEIRARFVKMVGENIVELDTAQSEDFNLQQIIEVLKSFRAVDI